VSPQKAEIRYKWAAPRGTRCVPDWVNRPYIVLSEPCTAVASDAVSGILSNPFLLIIRTSGCIESVTKAESVFRYRGLYTARCTEACGVQRESIVGGTSSLPIGEKGWISLRDAWHLFSQVDEQEAFGEMDEAGKRRLGEFAAYSTHRSDVSFMPTEGRVYFTRK
jgi:hypothetical protein